MEPDVNVVGGQLLPCSTDPLTGYYRNGCCSTGPEDLGSHTVCVVLTAEFLDYSKSVGNDLSTPRTEWGFAGLSPGDRWCLCASRWLEAHDAGYAPQVRFTLKRSLRDASCWNLLVVNGAAGLRRRSRFSTERTVQSAFSSATLIFSASSLVCDRRLLVTNADKAGVERRRLCPCRWRRSSSTLL